ncbi:MAG: diguanylate cyclase, partial [Alphaproteobacteria bacterium]
VDLIGRLGGEEFLLVLSHTSLDGAATAAERLRRALGAVEVPHGDTIIRMTGSFGVATWDHTESLDRLMSRADEALYKAKSGGRNLVVLDTGEGGSIALRRFDVPLVQSDTAPPERPMARRSSRPRAKKAVDS